MPFRKRVTWWIPGFKFMFLIVTFTTCHTFARYSSVNTFLDIELQFFKCLRMDINHWHILILRPGLAKGYIMQHCTVLLDLTFATGFTNETNKARAVFGLTYRGSTNDHENHKKSKTTWKFSNALRYNIRIGSVQVSCWLYWAPSLTLTVSFSPAWLTVT